MIKTISDYLKMIVDKLKFNKNPEKRNKNQMHAILKSDLSAKLKDNEQEVLFGCGCFWGAEKGFGGCQES